MIKITEAQLEIIREYLDDDAQSHIRAHGKWHLDGGKLLAALEEAGIAVEGDNTTFEWAVSIWSEMMSDIKLPLEQQMTTHFVNAADERAALEAAVEERAVELGTFDGTDLLERWPYTYKAIRVKTV